MAVYIKDGNTTFYMDPGASAHNQWGAGLTTTVLADKQHLQTVNVPSIDFARWMENHIPQGANILMKTDIEGVDEQGACAASPSVSLESKL